MSSKPSEATRETFRSIMDAVRTETSLVEMQRLAGRAMLLISDKEMQEQIRDAVVDRVKTIDWAKTKLNEFLEDNNITQKTDRRDAVSRSATLLLEVFLAGVKAGKESK